MTQVPNDRALGEIAALLLPRGVDLFDEVELRELMREVVRKHFTFGYDTGYRAGRRDMLTQLKPHLKDSGT